MGKTWKEKVLFREKFETYGWPLGDEICCTDLGQHGQKSSLSIDVDIAL